MKNIFIGFICLISALLIPISANAKGNVRIDSDFQVLEFNSISSEYLPRPTFLELVIKNKGKQNLLIKTDFIHKGEYAYLNKGLDFIPLKLKYVEDYIAAVEKYLKWQAVASKDRDIFTKEISKVKSVKFSFASGNSKDHYFIFENCVVACTTERYVLDYIGAQKFLKLLNKWKSGQLSTTTKSEIDDKYK